MKISFLKNKPDQDLPVSQVQTDSIQAIRARILNGVLIGASIIGVLDYFLVVIRSLSQTPLSAVVVYSLAVIWVIVITFARKFPYRLRAFSLVALIFLLGMTSYLQGGITTDGAIFILAFITMTGMLFGSRGTILAILIGLISASAVGIMMSTHVLVPTNPFSSDDPSGWINRGAVLALLGIVIGLSLTIMLRSLQENLNKANEMVSGLGKEQEELRHRSQEQERRSAEIRTAAEISRSISGVLTPQKLLRDAVTLILERLNLYYVGAFIVDEANAFAVLQAGTGEAGRTMVAAHHKFPIAESSMIGWAISHRQPRIALDVGQDAVRFANPLLPETRSELALPLVTKDRAIGAMTIQSEKPEAFDQEDILVFQSIADTLAIGIDNARLFEETERNLDELRISQRDYVTRAWAGSAQGNEEYEYNAASDEQTIQDAISNIDVPLILREQIIGQLHLEGQQDWSPEERALVEAVATQAALAMENARLLEESRQTASRERMAAEITGKVWSSPNIEFILQTAIKELGRALHADEASIELKMD
jgi:GAF domain-containing protein